ncbi:unnamed protein product [Rotaria magnacalcarata]|uniref:Glycylpeptide N-tetradecanoyltransferase n=1 Tax=Rotaria magnacalcarata TaxID=392030 RepID=A0A816ZVW7_9BILA|nr:unnamed protein product [Rotaria magnacalcarata]CAF1578270.1 unnamed protein product [Rotaria magnacalcarata]CAF2033853.1 unnamed protein product [Rotaria magnacalcarata]CAF2213926.1 unnamed protein product [Rotaria magnacalcarata]CAF2267109.1 unnamed protein product [Rotaria magnacalcarata]
MAEQEQAELNNTNETEATVSETTKSKKKNSQEKVAAATSSTIDVIDGNSTTAGQNINNNARSVESVQDLLKKIVLAEQASSLSNNRSAPKSDEEAASRQEWKFWHTQPVPSIGKKVTSENNGPVEENKPIEELKQEPYKLPDGFTWDEIDILDDEQLRELYVLLNENYVEDDDNMFRFDYSMQFLRWALCAPGWIRKWHAAVRVTKSRKMVGFISAVPIKMKAYEKIVPMVEINFLCVHKKLRLKRMAPVLIKEITRRVNVEGIFQAVYTAGVVLPGIVSKCRYWHRSLNVKKLIAVRFSHLGRNMTLQRMQKLYRLPEQTHVKGFREMREADVPKAFALLTQYLSKFDLAPIFTQEEFEYLCQNRPNIVSSFVVEQEDGEITDFISYYHLSSTIMNHPQYKTLNACYMYYHAASRTPLTDLVNDCLIQAHNNDFDVFNALDLMDNSDFLEKLKFGVGDGNLQYYIYNWQCPQMNPEKVALLLQ